MQQADFNLLVDKERSAWFFYHWYYDEIALKVKEPDNYRRFIELGAYKGHSICYLANEINKHKGDNIIEIYTVDTFKPTKTSSHTWQKEGDLKELCYANIEKLGMGEYVEVLEGKAHDKSFLFPDGYFDFVYIDADHKYESILEDIDDWLPKVRKGGILAGHDYASSQTGIRKAVDIKFGENKEIKKSGVWEVKIWE